MGQEFGWVPRSSGVSWGWLVKMASPLTYLMTQLEWLRGLRAGWNGCWVPVWGLVLTVGQIPWSSPRGIRGLSLSPGPLPAQQGRGNEVAGFPEHKSSSCWIFIRPQPRTGHCHLCAIFFWSKQVACQAMFAVEEGLHRYQEAWCMGVCSWHHGWLYRGPFVLYH